MSSQLPIQYSKPWLSIPDQVKLLEKRGLQITDRAAAEAFIEHTAYYRFSGYCLAFEDERHRFSPSTSFEDVQNAYVFDSSLRDLFREATELIEVDLRSTISHSFGEKHAAFGHTDPWNFHSKFGHAKWLQKLQTETKRSSEVFVNHFRRRYRQFPDLPIWAATEVMSFGSLSLMVSGMWKSDRQIIAKKYRLRPKQLSSIIHHFVYVRNLCAHHCRLWDREMTIKADLPNGIDWQKPAIPTNKRLWSSLLLVRWILSKNQQLNDVSTTWRDRVSDLLQRPPKTQTPHGKMGIPPNWESHPIWCA